MGGCVDESPPWNLLVFGDSPFRTTCEQGEETIDEEKHFVVGNADSSEDLFERDGPILDVLRHPRRQYERGTSRAGHLDTRGVYKVIENAHVAWERYSHHGVRQMPVKSGEEAETVLARKILAAASARTWDRQTARLPSKNILRFVNGNPESALDQLVRGAQASNAATQYGHMNGHIIKPYYSGLSCGYPNNPLGWFVGKPLGCCRDPETPKYGVRGNLDVACSGQCRRHPNFPETPKYGVRGNLDVAGIARCTLPRIGLLARKHLDPAVAPSVTFDAIYSPIES